MEMYMTQMQALTKQLSETIARASTGPSPQEIALQREIDTLKAAHKEELARLMASTKDQAATIAAVHQEKHTLLEAQLKDVTVKYTALKNFCEDAHGDAGPNVMPLMDELEAKLADIDADGEPSHICQQLKREVRKCVLVTKAREEDKAELMFSNQVYLQQINELQQKLVATQRDNKALQMRVDDGAAKYQVLLDDVDQLNKTVVPALEKAMEQNRQLKLQLQALKSSSASS
ncbi:hypothetical protein ACHHYP_07662 [Achlya hypogyna]|uniref:Uncharacterized protein n=1 Tax=Achlya hypogyna TaxID=1202772 RepID=A0A1V9YQM9_ACHHY|nr:hypothetical protein ACHHYP_07662 [Achlya hypogyna]